MKKTDQRRIVIPEPGRHFYKVTLEQKIGEVTIRAIIRHVSGADRMEAGTKAMIFHMKRNPNSEPTVHSIEREHYDRPIQI